MKNSTKLLSVVFLFSMLAFFFQGCVNLEQKSKINADGSGTMTVHYWTASSNITGDELSGFGFTEEKVKENYTSNSTEAADIKVEKNETDSTTHVSLNVKFKDFNKLNEAKAFSKIKSSWAKGKDGMDFVYTIPADPSNAGNMGMSDYKLNYVFEFPGEVAITNGKQDGMKVTWAKTIADLKEDIEMKATIKTAKKCGIFGMEFPIIIFGLFLGLGIRKYKSKK